MTINVSITARSHDQQVLLGFESKREITNKEVAGRCVAVDAIELNHLTFRNGTTDCLTLSGHFTWQNGR